MTWRTFDWKSHKVGQLGEVLNSVVYKCAFCKGTGLITYKRNTKCPVCLGKGQVSVSGFAVICAYCNANGRAYLNRDLTCNICKGKGVVSIGSREIQICNVCKGSGRERGSSLACLKCKGKGVIPSEEKDKVPENNLEASSFNNENNL